jgi:3-hydroxyisobutyrate dehydrogenase-like beta-hydroxyacid dehydrogenase
METGTLSQVDTRDCGVGFIGAGNMGKHMAASLLRAGYAVTIYDRRAAVRDEPVLAGASWADSPREVAQLCRMTITSLPGPVQVDQVVRGPDGILAGARAGDFYIDMSTSTPTNIRSIAAAAGELGVSVLDAPVAGGMRGARHGTLTIMVGASPAAFEHCLPVFKAMGEQIILVGGVGAGHVAKLVNNMMTIANGIVAMEAMVVGTKAGVDPRMLIEVAKAGTGDSFSLNLFPYVIFDGKFDPAKFALALATKDLRISQEFAGELGVPLRVIPSILAAMTDASEAGLADRDWSSYITLLEEAAGVQVRAPKAPKASG